MASVIPQPVLPSTHLYAVEIKQEIQQKAQTQQCTWVIFAISSVTEAGETVSKTPAKKFLFYHMTAVAKITQQRVPESPRTLLALKVDKYAMKEGFCQNREKL